MSSKGAGSSQQQSGKAGFVVSGVNPFGRAPKPPRTPPPTRHDPRYIARTFRWSPFDSEDHVQHSSSEMGHPEGDKGVFLYDPTSRGLQDRDDDDDDGIDGACYAAKPARTSPGPASPSPVETEEDMTSGVRQQGCATDVRQSIEGGIRSGPDFAARSDSPSSELGSPRTPAGGSSPLCAPSTKSPATTPAGESSPLFASSKSPATPLSEWSSPALRTGKQNAVLPDSPLGSRDEKPGTKKVDAASPTVPDDRLAPERRLGDSCDALIVSPGLVSSAPLPDSTEDIAVFTARTVAASSTQARASHQLSGASNSVVLQIRVARPPPQIESPPRRRRRRRRTQLELMIEAAERFGYGDLPDLSLVTRAGGPRVAGVDLRGATMCSGGRREVGPGGEDEVMVLAREWAEEVRRRRVEMVGDGRVP